MNRNIKILAWVSFLNDAASEATLRLLPLFLSQVLGAGTVAIGLIEGLAESTATLTKLLSGWISDRLPRRKPLVVAGYSISGLTKPFLLLATGWIAVLFIRFADRLGKGVRNAPRDALIADEAHAARRGHSFGLTRALDTAGAVTGLIIAFSVVAGAPVLTRQAFDTVVLIAIVPAIAAVALVAFGVREKSRRHLTDQPATASPTPPGPRPKLPPAYWRYMAVVALFTLSNSSDAFIVLKASSSQGMFGLGGVAFVLLCLIALNISQAVLAVPAGKLSDRIGRKQLIVSGWIIYAISYAGFAITSHPGVLLLLFILYGAFYGFAEGAERSLIADLVGPEQGRGLAYGVFSFIVGLMSFPASLLFGLAQSRWGAEISFFADAIIALIAAAGLIAFVPEARSSSLNATSA